MSRFPGHLIGQSGEHWNVVEPQVIVQVVSDPWATVAQFGGIMAASLISIWTVRSQSKREERARTRLLVGEFLAIPKVGPVLDLINHPNRRRSTLQVLAAKALKSMEPALAEAEIKGGIAAHHVSFESKGQIYMLLEAYRSLLTEIERLARGGKYNPDGFAALDDISELDRTLDYKYGNQRGSLHDLPGNRARRRVYAAKRP